MNNGQRMFKLISDVLDSLDLSIEQRAKRLKIASVDTGGYIPADLEEDISEINDMMIAKDIDGLLARLRIYPKNQQSEVTYLKGGRVCDRTAFMTFDQDVKYYSRAIKHPDSQKDRKLYSGMTLSEYQKTAFGKGSFSGGLISRLDKWVTMITSKHIKDRKLIPESMKGRITVVDVRRKYPNAIIYLDKVMRAELVDKFLAEWCKAPAVRVSGPDEHLSMSELLARGKRFTVYEQELLSQGVIKREKLCRMTRDEINALEQEIRQVVPKNDCIPFCLARLVEYTPTKRKKIKAPQMKPVTLQPTKVTLKDKQFDEVEDRVRVVGMSSDGTRV